MSEPDERQHTTEPAEGAERPGAGQDAGAHTEEPAEGKDLDLPGADTPST
jgi:hypothetical protein